MFDFDGSEIKKNPEVKVEEKKINPPKVHRLKIFKKHYLDIYYGRKKAEIRKNDRYFKVGELIAFTVLNEEMEIVDQPLAKYLITHVLYYPEGLRDGYVLLSIEKAKVL